MKIKPEVSNVDSNLTYQIAAQVNNTVPIVASTTAETNVMVQDGTTIIIGGLRKDQKLKTVNKLPYWETFLLLARPLEIKAIR